MTFAKCLHLNRSVTSLARAANELVLPGNERTPIYRRQVGSIFSVEYSGEQRLSHENRRASGRRPAPGYLF